MEQYGIDAIAEKEAQERADKTWYGTPGIAGIKGPTGTPGNKKSKYDLTIDEEELLLIL